MSHQPPNNSIEDDGEMVRGEAENPGEWETLVEDHGAAKEQHAPREGYLRRFARYHGAPPAAANTLLDSLAGLMRFWIRPINLVCAVLFLGLCYLLYHQAAVYWVGVIDDAYITFRFVDNFIQGHGWRYNPAGYRVEGFTNFLWAVLLLVPHALKCDLMFSAKVMGLASGMLAMAASWGLARAIRNRDDVFNLLPAFLLATNPYFAQWTMNGLETLLQVALVTGCFWRFEAERRNPRLWLMSPALAVLAAMTRIDSLYFLSPLGLYGMWLIIRLRLPWRRFLRWGIYCAIPFALYWGWKTSYFGDILPNTYYAKDRLVTTREMGHAQLHHFYFRPADITGREPAPFDKIDWSRPHAWIGALDRVFWRMPGGNATRSARTEDPGAKSPREVFPQKPSQIPRYVANAAISSPSVLWVGYWLSGLFLCAGLAVALPIIGLFSRRRDSLFDDTHLGRIGCLVLLPWGMGVYYVHHVNGDWMPAFRFFQNTLPFIGVAVAVGFGTLYGLAAAYLTRWIKRIPVGVALFLVAGYLAVGSAHEHLKVNSVSIYGWESIHWSERRPDWYYPERVHADYRAGFAPPLREVADHLLLNTVDDGWIFMSDIGQPMWFAEHLNLYDVDGLTDPFLGHAPSVRGRLPKIGDVERKVIAEMELSGVPLDPDEVEKRTRRRDFENHLARNTEYIMVHRRPEYLLLFENHPTPDPKTKGYVYPEISNAVSRHRNMRDYKDVTQFPKIGNVYNHVYRRLDVAGEIPDDVKLRRLFRVIERNPRMPYLIALLYEQSLKMKDITPEDQERISGIMETAYERWRGEPYLIAELARLSRQQGNTSVLLPTLERALEEDPRNIATYWTLADIFQQEGKLDKAIEIMERALPHEAPNSNLVQYHLTWLYERSGDFPKAVESARRALEKSPREGRAWSDLGAVLERSIYNVRLSKEERVKNARESIEAFKNFQKFSPRDSAHVPEILERLKAFIAEDERQIAPPPPPASTESAYR